MRTGDRLNGHCGTFVFSLEGSGHLSVLLILATNQEGNKPPLSNELIDKEVCEKLLHYKRT